jgi:DEAD/DEAH box helicase domain-containing protein
MVAQDDPLDQFYMRHPTQFFSRSVEHARIALDNPYILIDELRCAAFELPLHDADEYWFGATFPALRDWLLRRGELAELPDGRYEFTSRWPSAQVNIRSADGESVELADTESGRVIEQLGATRAPFEIYPGAIYLHQGDSYLVESLSERRALARRTQAGYYTQTKEETNIRIERIREQRRVGPAFLHVGVVEVTRQVTGYRRKEHYSESVLSEHELSMPPQTFRTIAVWWTVPEIICQQTEQHCDEVVDALHAMEHACIGLLPMFAQCDRADIGGLSTDMHPQTGMATIFVYDGVPGGVGIAQVGYEQAEAWWQQTRSLLLECACLDGCPACIQSPKCGNGNQHLSKRGAAALASLLLEQPIPGRTLGQRLTPTGSVLAGTTGAHSVIADLQGRLERARIESSGPRRAALIAALRYRIRVERDSLSPQDQLILNQIETELVTL